MIAAGDAFDGPDLCSFNLQDWHQTTVDELTVNQYGTCPALSLAATFFRSGQVQLFAQHIEQALQCIDFEDVQPKLIQSEGELLISHSLFEIRKWMLDGRREVAPLGQFAIICCLTGSLNCASVELAPGEIFLVPAYLQNRQLKSLASRTSLLRVTIPQL